MRASITGNCKSIAQETRERCAIPIAVEGNVAITDDIVAWEEAEAPGLMTPDTILTNRAGSTGQSSCPVQFPGRT